MPAVRTAHLPESPDDSAPGGVAEIRLLLQLPTGDITHSTVAAGAVSQLSSLHPSTECFLTLEGHGVLWDAVTEREIEMPPGRFARIPAGTPFQYRADATWRILVVVVPHWRPEHHHVTAGGEHWPPTHPTDGAEPTPEQLVGSGIQVHDWADEPDDVAPDGSRTFLLGAEPGGEVVGYVLPAGQVSTPARQDAAEQLWYVIDGTGEASRHQADLPADLTPLTPGTCFDVGLGISLELRADTDLRMVRLTMPWRTGAAAGLER
jgi:mannose-6-phosphate isomerase-like protein (cupin superfamily)